MGLKVSSVTGEGLSEQGHPLGSAGGSGWISSCEQTNTHTRGILQDRGAPAAAAAPRLPRDAGSGDGRDVSSEGWFWVWSFTPSGALSARQAANASRGRREHLQNPSWCCGETREGVGAAALAVSEKSCSAQPCWKNPTPSTSVPLL